MALSTGLDDWFDGVWGRNYQSVLEAFHINVAHWWQLSGTLLVAALFAWQRRDSENLRRDCACGTYIPGT